MVLASNYKSISMDEGKINTELLHVIEYIDTRRYC
jgi:hypothetical protein